MAFVAGDSSPHTLPRDAFILDTHACASTLRSRRPHSKSRRGCIRCKQQRKKCDETRPRCKRCATRNHVCKWSEAQSTGEGGGGNGRGAQLQTRDGFSFDHVLASTTGRSSSPLSSISTCSANAYEFDFSALAHDPQIDTFFSASELALLSHYLTHTSRVFSYDEHDSYVLRVGIPNLALGNKPLTSSLLALAAIDRCNQLTECKNLSAADLDIVHSFLALGDWHHRNALRLIQCFIPDSKSYDHVLANAPLMVLYGTASHCIRVRIERRFKQNTESIPSALQPLQSQWVLLIRAAYTAFMGVANSFDEGSPDDLEQHDAKTRRVHAQRPEILAAGVTRAYSAEDGPTERTRCLLNPVMAMTHSQALERLQSYAEILDFERMHSMETVDLLACLETLDILRAIFATVFSGRNSLSNNDEDGSLSSGIASGKSSSLISPWLQKYVARVTYVTPSRPLRRIIMSFVNRVPSKYLTLVEAALEVMNAASSQELDTPIQQHDDSYWSPELGTLQALALDIFAHWLVLVMLLDGVWWIGDIGDWELERIIESMRTHGILLPTASGTDWWPRQMYHTKRKLAG